MYVSSLKDFYIDIIPFSPIFFSYPPGLVLILFCTDTLGADTFLCGGPGGARLVADVGVVVSFSCGTSFVGRMIGSVFDLCNSLFALKIDNHTLIYINSNFKSPY